MSERAGADDRTLAVASSIAEGLPVDWEQVNPDTDATTTAVLEELRVLEDLAHVSHGRTRSWGPFTLLAELGHGSYGTVYRAKDATLDLEVALKVLRPRSPRHPAEASRALNEARLLAQVTHPNVVRIYRAERRGDDVAVAMELLNGQTLDDLVFRQGPFSAREAMLIGIDICCGLAAVHGARLVHGDVKAQNVMRAAGGRTVLMDFGAGYDVKTDAGGGLRLAGTPLYLAPEVFAGQPRSPLSDVYAVGVLLFYLATGRFPVDGHSGSDVRHRHEQRTPPRLLRDLRADLPDAFIQVVERAIATNPADRHQSAGELEAALRHALLQDAPQPVPAPRPFRLVSIAAGIAGVALSVAVGVWRINAPSATPEPAAAAALVGPAAPAAGGAVAEPTYRIEAAFHRDQDGRDVPLGPGSRIRPGDRLSLQVTSSVPTYLYVVNEDDRGESYLLFPLPGLPTANPLPADTRHQIPGPAGGERVYWTVSSAGGREHFLIFASPQPLSPAFQRLFDGLPRPTAEASPSPQRLSADMVGALRGVGGLATRPEPAPTSGPGLRADFGAPLTAGEEEARGVWVRQLTLDNPGR